MNIAVLCAGISSEREVSIVSGTQVCKALIAKGHKAVLLDLFFGNKDTDIFDHYDEFDVDAESSRIKSLSKFVNREKAKRTDVFGENVIEICKKSDIVFLALHGKYGEDGMVQAAFDLMGIKYTGSNHLASAIGMDKGLTKQVFLGKNVPTAPAVWIRRGDDTSLAAINMELPLVVKACNGGSSVGVYRSFTAEEYNVAVDKCFELDDEIIVEKFIEGREFSVGVVNNKALPIVEIKPINGWYDYENKYAEGAVDEICPAELSSEEEEAMKEAAENACKAIGCFPYARADFMMDNDGNLYCLEVNTLPGMTPTSLVPREARCVGMSFEDLCERLLELSFEKYNKD